MAITLVLAFGMVWVSTRIKFVPYVVEVDKLGRALAAAEITRPPQQDQALALASATKANLSTGRKDRAGQCLIYFFLFYR
jgi:type IV secretory pathway TrbF-like protein